MWRNYMTTGVRALLKNKTYAFINIFGLGVGLAACLMLLIYVRYERSYDEWLPNAENVYQFQSHFRDPDTGEESDLAMSPFIAGPILRKDFPQIERSVYVLQTRPVVLRGGQALPTQDTILVDNLFFDVLPVPLVRGDPRTALSELHSVVLSETEARRLFGDADPIGQTLTFIMVGRNVDHRITGVMRDLPRNSHMRLSIVARFDPQSYFADNPTFLTQWGSNSGWNYIRLRPGSDPGEIQGALPQWEQRNIPDQTFGDQVVNQGDYVDWNLVNVRDVHLSPASDGLMSPGNDERTIVTFTIVAFLILGMACVNFTNLATARASQRAREVALRKVLGANRQQLITQFLAESVLVAALAMLLALAMVELLLPTLGHFLNADLAMTYIGEGSMILPIILLTLLVGAAGGIYPAFYLSRFQPAQVLKANKSTAEAAGSGRLRNVLVVGQFAISIGLIICTAIVYAQTVHARTADPGYKRDGLLQVADLNRRQLEGRGESIAREIARVPGITSVGRTSIGVATDSQNAEGVIVPGRDQPVIIGNYTMDESFLPTMGIEFLAGRPLTRSRPMDFDPRTFPTPIEADRAMVARGLNVVANELAIERLGFSSPRAAIGAQLRMSIAQEEAGVVPITIVGVVRNSRFRSIREPVEPIIFRLTEFNLTHLVARYDLAQANSVRDRVEQVWRRLAPDVPFNAEFSEEIVAELYNVEEARAQVFAGFALLAIIVACLGLFGLAAFTAERRTKEIGIRKVLGARTRDIVRLLAWQFSKPIIIANLIAWPIAWWVMRDWLNTFDARIDLGPTPFVLAGLVALAIAIGTIAGHAFKVARANPIHALRYE